MDLNEQNKIMLDAILKRFDENEKRLMEEINSLKVANEGLRNRVDVMEKTVQNQKEVILQLEKRLNSNNIIIHGVDENKDDTGLEDALIDLLNSKLAVNIKKHDVQQVYRLGNNKYNARPIKVLLNNHKTKLSIMKEKKKLAGTSIFINDDLPKELRIREADERRKKREAYSKRGSKRPVAQSSSEMDDTVDKITQDIKRKN